MFLFLKNHFHYCILSHIKRQGKIVLKFYKELIIKYPPILSGVELTALLDTALLCSIVYITYTLHSMEAAVPKPQYRVHGKKTKASTRLLIKYSFLNTC